MNRSRLTYLILIIVFIVGLSLLLYPPLSEYWNSFRQSRAIAEYAESLAALDAAEKAALIDAAEEYNKWLLGRQTGFALTQEQKEAYNKLLNVSSNGVMGYIDIPTIGVSLPIYHGTEEKVLQIAIGHLEWSSMPVGGPSTHSVMSGHRGLPSAKLFTDLDELIVGDRFMVSVLNDIYTYEVDKILIVEPDQTEELGIVAGEDYCTLFTCTPYGINSHRLLVRGHRVPNIETSEVARVIADSAQIDPLVATPIMLLPFLVIGLVVLMFDDRAQFGKYRKVTLDDVRKSRNNAENSEAVEKTDKKAEKKKKKQKEE